ncbi:hypothetical protein ACLI4Q_05245 [Natrialbaceae archaeon A-CW1-1]
MFERDSHYYREEELSFVSFFPDLFKAVPNAPYDPHQKNARSDDDLNPYDGFVLHVTEPDDNHHPQK